MAQPLMPKATAVWLVDNTILTFEQVADFCGLHALEVQAIADGDVGVGINGSDPVVHGELSSEEIARCEKNSKATLIMSKSDLPKATQRSKGPRYTPLAKRGHKPDGIAWLLKNHVYLVDSQIIKLIGTTKPTIQSIREKKHTNMTNIKPEDPVLLGLCTQVELNAAIEKAEKKLEKAGKSIKPSVVEIEEDIATTL